MKKTVTPEKKPTLYVGLDVGTTKIATIIGYKNGDGKIDVLGYGKGNSTGVQHGLIMNINKTVDGIISSKECAVNRSNQQISDVYVGVAGRHIKSSDFKHTITRKNGDEVIIEQDEIDKMIQDMEGLTISSSDDIISVIPQRFQINGERDTMDPVGELGQLLTGYFQIISGNSKEIRKIIQCVELSQLNVKKVVLEPIASGLSCLSDEEKRDGAVLVDIGGGTTDIAIYLHGNPVYTRVIPIGGAVITHDISAVCRIQEEVAEKLKTKHGTCIVEKSNSNNFINIPQAYGQAPKQISETLLAQIIHARVLEDILKPIKNEIEISGYEKQLLGGVILTGGGAMLRNIKELTQFVLQKPVRIGVPEFGFVQSLPAELKNPIFSTSLGLLKYGILNENADSFDETTISNSDEYSEDEGRSGGSFVNVVKSFLENLITDKSS